MEKKMLLSSDTTRLQSEGERERGGETETYCIPEYGLALKLKLLSVPDDVLFLMILCS
jgi:hypothetical protein